MGSPATRPRSLALARSHGRNIQGNRTKSEEVVQFLRLDRCLAPHTLALAESGFDFLTTLTEETKKTQRPTTTTANLSTPLHTLKLGFVFRAISKARRTSRVSMIPSMQVTVIVDGHQRQATQCRWPQIEKSRVYLARSLSGKKVKCEFEKREGSAARERRWNSKRLGSGQAPFLARGFDLFLFFFSCGSEKNEVVEILPATWRGPLSLVCSLTRLALFGLSLVHTTRASTLPRWRQLRPWRTLPTRR